MLNLGNMSQIARLTFINPRRRINFSNNILDKRTNDSLFQVTAENYRSFSAQPEKSKLRKFFDEYGKLGIGVYLGISVISVSSFYTAIKLGFDMNSILEKFNLQDNKLVSKAGPFALAYGIHKIFAPVRVFLAFIITPVIKRRFFKNK